MRFCDSFNDYIKALKCTSKEIAMLSGVSEATLSRYRSGERVPEQSANTIEKIAAAIAEIAQKRGMEGYAQSDVIEKLLLCDDIKPEPKRLVRRNLNELISVLDINITKLCRKTNYDPSTVFRIKNGSRQPSDPVSFARSVAEYVANELDSDQSLAILAKLLNASESQLKTAESRTEAVENWLLSKSADTDEEISAFLQKLNEFDLNEYIKAIKFDNLKVPTAPFLFPTSKHYSGIENLMESELDFLKATVLSKSHDSVTMFSDMPMEQMAEDAEFPKKWMFGMALMLKKGLHLNMIHDVDRPFNEMMLGLESYIPMYMTGQISPFYIKGKPSSVFNHLLKVSGSAALSGEAIGGDLDNARYYLTKNREELAYYKKRADALLKQSQPLMEIYRSDRESALSAFLLSERNEKCKTRNILSSLPLFTISNELLERIAERCGINGDDRKKLFDYAASQKETVMETLEKSVVETEIPKPDFENGSVNLSVSGMFFENDIPYLEQEYKEHLKSTLEFAKQNKNFKVTVTEKRTFSNLEILIKSGKWVMISKTKSPAIHFVIHHPRLLKAIESFKPPVLEEDNR